MPLLRKVTAVNWSHFSSFAWFLESFTQTQFLASIRVQLISNIVVRATAHLWACVFTQRQTLTLPAGLQRGPPSSQCAGGRADTVCSVCAAETHGARPARHVRRDSRRRAASGSRWERRRIGAIRYRALLPESRRADRSTGTMYYASAAAPGTWCPGTAAGIVNQSSAPEMGAIREAAKRRVRTPPFTWQRETAVCRYLNVERGQVYGDTMRTGVCDISCRQKYTICAVQPTWSTSNTPTSRFMHAEL